jgi:hypothetical protein
MEIDLEPLRQDTRLMTFVTHSQKLLEAPVEDFLFRRFSLSDVCGVHAFLAPNFTTDRRSGHHRSG